MTHLTTFYQTLRNTLLCCTLLLATTACFAQQLQLSSLLGYLDTSPSLFERAMLEQGFVCFQNTISVRGWSCVFAYQPAPYLAGPANAVALIQRTQNARSDVVVYQVRSWIHYQRLQQQLLKAGYRVSISPDQRCIFSRDNVVINCRQTDQTSGILGNYAGHSITLIRQRY